MPLNPLLNDATLKKFIEGVRISQEKKDFLISKLPELNEEERTKLFKVLKDIYLLDIEEQKATERIKDFFGRLNEEKLSTI